MCTIAEDTCNTLPQTARKVDTKNILAQCYMKGALSFYTRGQTHGSRPEHQLLLCRSWAGRRNLGSFWARLSQRGWRAARWMTHALRCRASSAASR